MAYSDDVRAQCMAALLMGQGVSNVAETFKVPKPTISRWRKSLVKSGLFSLVSEQNGTKKGNDRLGGLIMKYLEKGLETLHDQLDVFGDPKFLKQQSASEAAVLHGVLADKVIRILEALEEAAVNEGE